MLTGLLAPSEGDIFVLGKDMRDARQAARGQEPDVGVVPEDLALFDNLTAREYLTFVGRMYLRAARHHPQAHRRAAAASLGLEDEEKKLTLEYSHGMKKKLALAAALAAQSRFAVSR